MSGQVVTVVDRTPSEVGVQPGSSVVIVTEPVSSVLVDYQRVRVNVTTEEQVVQAPTVESVVQLLERTTRVEVGASGPQGPRGYGALLYPLAGENVNALHVVVIHPDDNAWLADSNTPSDAELMVGITTVAALTGEPLEVATTGDIQATHGLPIGPLYLGAGGVLTSNHETGVFQLFMGAAVSATRIIVRPGLPIFRA